MSDEHLMNYLDASNKREETNETEKYNQDDTKRLGDLDWLSIPANTLPCKYFYPTGSDILISPSKIKQIQSYSMMDENNIIDVFEKVNDLLENNVMVKLPTGEKKSSKYMLDNDKWYVLHLIRDLTFPKKPSLYTKVDDVKIPLSKETFFFYLLEDSDYYKYYNQDRRRLILDYGVEIAPPTLGLQKSFMDYIFDCTKKGEKLNMSFIKIAPYLFPGKVHMSIEKLREEQANYENMDMDKFLFLDENIKNLKFGIKGVKLDSGDGEVHSSEDVFPRGFRGILLSFDTDN